MSRFSLALPRVAAALAAGTLLAACGGGSHPSRSARGTQMAHMNGLRMTVAQANAAMLRFAGCMKSHGVNGLPSPIAAPTAFKHSFTTTTPVYRSALGTCQRLIPGQRTDRAGSAHSHKQIEGMLAFAKCIRRHGFTRFPDPTSTGDMTHQMLAQAGIDLHQPAIVRAAYACTGVSSGVITRAMVRRFVAGE